MTRLRRSYSPGGKSLNEKIWLQKNKEKRVKMNKYIYETTVRINAKSEESAQDILNGLSVGELDFQLVEILEDNEEQ
jgi:hypothetical protein